MVTISHVVKKIVNAHPVIYDSILYGIVNFANLAEHITPLVVQELGEEVHGPAIVMALRRYADVISEKERVQSDFSFKSEIIMKTGLTDLTFVKSPSLLRSLKEIYGLIDFDHGDTLNVIHGNYEITIVVTERYAKKIQQILQNEKILNIEKNLVSLAMGFAKDFLYTPGIIAKVTRTLAWHNVNIFENISTMTELIFIVNKKDAMRAYTTLQNIVDGKS